MDRLNIETAAFLRELRRFSVQNPIQITENTAELLIEVIECAEQLIATADIIPAENQIATGYQLNVSIGWTKLLNSSIVLYFILFYYADGFVFVWTSRSKAAHQKQTLELTYKVNQVWTAVSIKLIVVVMKKKCHIAFSLIISIISMVIFLIFWFLIAVKHSSDAQALSQPVNCDSLYVIRVENFPWTATKQNFVHFFGNVKFFNGENGIHFIVDNVETRTNAFIQLASSQDYHMAMKRKQLRMFNFTVNS